jgi:hypothetical protein
MDGGTAQSLDGERRLRLWTRSSQALTDLTKLRGRDLFVPKDPIKHTGTTESFHQVPVDPTRRSGLRNRNEGGSEILCI